MNAEFGRSATGIAEVLGVPIQQTRQLRPRIGVALQEVALDLGLIAREQLELGLAMTGGAANADLA